MNKKIEEIEKLIKDDYILNRKLAIEIKEIYKKYKPLYDTDFYIDFIKRNDTSFSIKDKTLWNDEKNILIIFTIESQHIRGNSLEDCIDKYTVMKEKT